MRFGSLQPFTVRNIGDFPHFLSALASNDQFIVKLAKMWPGETFHVVVGTLKVSRLKVTGYSLGCVRGPNARYLVVLNRT